MNEQNYGYLRASIAYKAYQNMAENLDEEGLSGHSLKFDDLDEGTKQCWIAAAESVHTHSIEPFVKAL